jgi:hypothetical protein
MRVAGCERVQAKDQNNKASCTPHHNVNHPPNQQENIAGLIGRPPCALENHMAFLNGWPSSLCPSGTKWQMHISFCNHPSNASTAAQVHQMHPMLQQLHQAADKASCCCQQQQ